MVKYTLVMSRHDSDYSREYSEYPAAMSEFRQACRDKANEEISLYRKGASGIEIRLAHCDNTYFGRS